MHVQCLLWDFGDTLCDELSLWRVSPEWMAVYRSFDEEDGIGAAWNLGKLDTQGVVSKLARRMTLSEAEIQAHLSRTDLFEFFPFTYDFFRARHLPQAIVTVNPARFREIARDLAFDQVTDTIVVSAEERTIDKGVLCETCFPGPRLLDVGYAAWLWLDIGFPDQDPVVTGRRLVTLFHASRQLAPASAPSAVLAAQTWLHYRCQASARHGPQTQEVARWALRCRAWVVENRRAIERGLTQREGAA